MRGMNFDAKMVSNLPYGLLPEFYQQLGKDAEFVYSATFWEAGLPNPGNQDFVAAYQREFNRAPAVQSAIKDAMLDDIAGSRAHVRGLGRAAEAAAAEAREAAIASSRRPSRSNASALKRNHVKCVAP